MLGRILLAGIIGALILGAADFHGTWAGNLVLDNRETRISVTLHQVKQSAWGTVTVGDGEPRRIENLELTGDLLTFAVRDSSGSAVRFRLRAVQGPLIGEVFHGGEALAGEAQYGIHIAQIMLPSHRGGTVPPAVISSVPAEYSEEARRAKLEGAVRMSVLIDV